MSTYLQLKTKTANVLGRNDGGTANAIRDNIINSVIQDEIANSFPYSWNRKTNASISIDSNGQSDLPSDYNPTHKLYDVREVASGTANDVIYREQPRELFDSLSIATGGYFIDYNTNTNVYRINTSVPSKTLQIIYYYIPATLTADADICVVPNADAVVYLAAASFWLSAERDETNHDRFKQLGLQKVAEMIQRDKKAQPRVRRGSMFGANMGWNV